MPLGIDEAEREVQVTVESIPAIQPLAHDEWAACDSMAGSWQGEFERPEQAKLEERDAF
ncbi:MAG: hypothetical protein AB7K24_33270 [Gemmataceae bacterium]